MPTCTCAPRRLDVAPLQSLISVPLNVTHRQRPAEHRTAGCAIVTHQPQALIDWRGRVTLGNVRVQDKLTGDDFLRWNSLNASGLERASGRGRAARDGRRAGARRLLCPRDHQRERAPEPAGRGGQSSGGAGLGDPGADCACGRRTAEPQAAPAPAATAAGTSRGHPDRPDHPGTRPPQLHRQLHQAELHRQHHPARRQDRRVRHVPAAARRPSLPCRASSTTTRRWTSPARSTRWRRWPSST